MCLTLCANDGDEASHSVTSAKPTILIRISKSFRVGERRDCRSISARIFGAIRGDSRWQLVRIRLDAVILNQAVLVRDAERIEKGAHHVAMFGEMVNHQRAR